MSYRYPEAVPFKEGVLEALKGMGAVVKICSGLPLTGAKKIVFVESLGLTAADYIYAGNKAQGISQFIAADYAAQQQAGNGEANPTYVAVLMDNLGGPAQSHNSSAIDNFNAQMVAASSQLPSGVRAIPLPVYSSRFETEINRDRAQIAQEIDWAIQLKERAQRAQEEMVKAAQDRLAAQLREQAQKEEAAKAAQLSSKPKDDDVKEESSGRLDVNQT